MMSLISPTQQRWLTLWHQPDAWCTPLSFCAVKFSAEVELSGLRNCAQQLADTQSMMLLEQPSAQPLDWQGLLPDTDADEWLALWQQQRWDLQTGPLLRMAVLAQQEAFVLLVCAPSLMMDEQSVVMLAQHLLAQQSPTEQPMPYSQVSSWGWETLAERNNDQVTFWHDFIEGGQQANGYSWLKVSDLARSGAMSVYRAANGDVIHRLLRQLNTVIDCPLDDLLTAAWSVLVSRWQPEAGLVMGEVLDGRSLAELDKVLGLLSKVVPYRLEPLDQRRFTDWANEVASVREAATEYQDYFILGESGLVHDFCPFQVQFRPVVVMDNGQLISRQGDFEPCLARLVVEPASQDILLQYDGVYLSASAGELMIRDLTQILRQLLEQPDCTIEQLQSTGAFMPDMPDMPDCVMDCAMDYVNSRYPSQDIATAWRAQVLAHPAQLAVADGSTALSYQQLDHQSDSLASILREQGVGAGDVVMLQLRKCTASIIAILAVQKLAAAYLPVDPSLPPLRVARFEAEAGVRLTVSLSAEQWVFTPGTEPQRMALQGHVLDSRAYILYTSGSTGVSKGVQVSQRAIMDLTDSLLDEIYSNRDEAAVIALVASLSFDAAVQQIYPALLGGHTLVIMADEDKSDPAKMCAQLRRYQVGFMDCTPSLLGILLDQADFHQLGIEAILVGGEKLETALVACVFARLSAQPIVWNLYGLTECTVDSICMKIEPQGFEHWLAQSQLPVGLPLPHCRFWLLDRLGRQVPQGLPGELVIGGSAVALGYVNDPVENQRRFWKNRPISPVDVFSTGDYARLPADGLLRFIGRMDSQVKISGFRVDLLEIKQACFDSGGVSAIEVLVEGEHFIIAVVCLKADFQCDDLRHQLRQTLPRYMIPGRIVAIDVMPLNASGKVDRIALHKWLQRQQQDKTSRPVKNAMEARLLGLFSGLLNQPLSCDDDFFVFGAHSLVLLQAIMAITRDFGQAVDFDTIYQYSNVAALADHLLVNNTWSRAKRLKSLADSHLDHPSSDIADNTSVFFLPCVLGSSAIFTLLPLQSQWAAWGLDYYTTDQPSYGSIEALAEVMYQQIIELDQRQEVILVGYSMGAYVSYEVARLLQLEGKNPGLILIDCHVDSTAVGNSVVTSNQQPDSLTAMKAQQRLPVAQFCLGEPLNIPIVAFEAKDNQIPADMTLWAQYASTFLHHYIPGKHDTVFCSAFASQLSATLHHAMETLIATLYRSK